MRRKATPSRPSPNGKEEETSHGFNHFPPEIHEDKPLKRLCGRAEVSIPTVETVGYSIGERGAAVTQTEPLA